LKLKYFRENTSHEFIERQFVANSEVSVIGYQTDSDSLCLTDGADIYRDLK